MPSERQRQSEGQVVYRRIGPPEDDARATGPRMPRLDPGLVPLVMGFALVLLLIFVLGNLSIRRIEDTSSEALNLGSSLSERNKVMLELRVALTKLDNEARDRMGAEARREIRPPFDMRLAKARSEAGDILPKLDRLPLSNLPKWRQFRDDVAAYIDLTKDNERYVHDGFAKFRDLDAQLNELVGELATEQGVASQTAEAMQRSATRTIRLWNLFALLAGLAVAIATTWQVQRRFRQTREITEAVRREREFNNQMLEGMVSA
ncbi:MAG: hypothetical protein ACXW18_12820, partial [Pyrinomonadaceae bacterium]